MTWTWTWIQIINIINRLCSIVYTYKSYTHCTCVQFTWNNGDVDLGRPISTFNTNDFRIVHQIMPSIHAIVRRATALPNKHYERQRKAHTAHLCVCVMTDFPSQFQMQMQAIVQYLLLLHKQMRMKNKSMVYYFQRRTHQREHRINK